MTYDILTILFVILAGIFDGAQAAKKDLPLTSKFVDWFSGHPKLLVWYYGVGGNAGWNPSYPFSFFLSVPYLGIWLADFWHTMKFGWIYSFSAAIAMQVWKYNDWRYGLGAFLLFQFTERTTFRWFYGYAFRQEPVGTFWTFVRATFNRSDNNHTTDKA